jgi:hypothetical protein
MNPINYVYKKKHNEIIMRFMTGDVIIGFGINEQWGRHFELRLVHRLNCNGYRELFLKRKRIYDGT